ncbi:MAG: endonuclease/exonuclease/phosphatase family protein [Woeseiaceae bacterium]|nr:endonuclease/exonuclease/phosphatase family protein [Woeseiaceae bacterium]
MNRFLGLLATLVFLASCAVAPVTGDLAKVPVKSELSACVDSLKNSEQNHSKALDADGFSLLNWNIKKAKHPEWPSDLERLGTTASLVTLQEAVPDLPVSRKFGRLHWSFAEGFGFRDNLTGVMTLSDVRPIAACQFAELEPVFRTRKATLVTNYPISGIDETLLVINLHGVNFSMGLGALETQLDEASHIISSHIGPVIVSGDFNTWRRGRHSLVEDLMAAHELSPVEFEEDHRKRFMGWPLDHILVRGLEATQATTHELDSSDHNPMYVRLVLSNDS